MAADNKLVWALSAAMSGFLKTKATSASQFREILQNSDIAVSATTIDGTKFITDSDVQFQGSRYVIMEVKKTR
jgi:hypothetical protein